MDKGNLKWDYGGVYKNYDMAGEISIGTGIISVHNIFEPIPNFMKNADVIFCDPPCSKSNINSFYTKADIFEKQNSYEPFQNRFFECIDEIKPRILFIEVFKSNYNNFLSEISKRYNFIKVYNSMYYNNPKNKCWVIQGSNIELSLNLNDIDEQKAIEVICKNLDFDCIGDLCMGRGLVGFYANKYNKKFVGTELNKKRLAILLQRIERGKI